jgi:eukaryotic-like serine/threonine-protein kinase
MMARELFGGRYELRGILGRGGMAEVHDGWDTRLGRAVAINLLHPGFADHPETRLRFEAEARSAAALNHPHIVAVHDSGEHNGMPFIVMERLSGSSLAGYIARGPVPEPVVRSVLDGVLSALACAHEAGILHRDIKPGNILFAADGEPKVSDFGIAKMADAVHTMTGQVVGTMAYLSPQRLVGYPATPSDDLYAVGVVGYEALTGRRPFMQDNFGALARAILEGQYPPLAAMMRVDPTLAAVTERAIARDPRWRFRAARAMRAALAGVAPGEPGQPAGPAALAGVAPGAVQPGQLTGTDATRDMWRPGPARRVATKVLDAPLPNTFGIVARPSWATRNRKALGVAAVVATFLLATVLLVFDSPFQSSAPGPAPTSTPTTALTTPPTSTPSLVEEPPPAQHPPGKSGKGRGHGH